MSAPSRVTTDFTLSPLPFNAQWLYRAVIVACCTILKFSVFDCFCINIDPFGWTWRLLGSAGLPPYTMFVVVSARITQELDALPYNVLQ